jgi:hypothetical protein
MRALISLVIGTLTALSASDAVAGTDRPVSSPQAACGILKLGAVERRLSVQDRTGRYYCDYVDPPVFRGEYYLLGLRYHTDRQEQVGSDLIGWFVVRIRDGELFEYDMGDEQIKPLRPPHQWTK